MRYNNIWKFEIHILKMLKKTLKKIGIRITIYSNVFTQSLLRDLVMQQITIIYPLNVWSSHLISVEFFHFQFDKLVSLPDFGGHFSLGLSTTLPSFQDCQILIFNFQQQ